MQLHLPEHLVTQRDAVRRIGTQARNLFGVHAKRIEEVIENEQLAIDKAPVNTLTINQVIKLLFGKLRPLLANHRNSLIARHRKMKRRLEHAIPLGTNTSSQRRPRALLQKAIAGSNSLRQISGILETKNLGRQSNIEMTKVITANINRATNRTLVNNLPIRRQHINNSHTKLQVIRTLEVHCSEIKKKAPTREPSTPPNGSQKMNSAQ